MSKLTVRLSKDSDMHGLYELASRGIQRPKNRHLVIALVDCEKVTTDIDTRINDATLRILSLEEVTPEDLLEGARLYLAAMYERLGKRTPREALHGKYEHVKSLLFGEGKADVDHGEFLPPAGSENVSAYSVPKPEADFEDVPLPLYEGEDFDEEEWALDENAQSAEEEDSATYSAPISMTVIDGESGEVQL